MMSQEASSWPVLYRVFGTWWKVHHTHQLPTLAKVPVKFRFGFFAASQNEMSSTRALNKQSNTPAESLIRRACLTYHQSANLLDKNHSGSSNSSGAQYLAQ
jgi:hypothetical protein